MEPPETWTFCSRSAGNDIACGHAVGGELLRVEPDAQRIFTLAEKKNVADSVQPDQYVADARAGVVGNIKLVVAVVRRKQMNDHHQIRRALRRGDADAPDFLGKPGLGDRNTILHQHLCLIEIGPELEGDRQRHRTVSGGIGGHVEHVLHAVDLLLERGSNGIGDGLRIRARIGGAHDDGWRCDLRILRHRKLKIGDAADDQQNDR
jgi:hypothetical protein